MDWFWEALTGWIRAPVRPPYALVNPWVAIAITQAFGFLGVMVIRQFLEGDHYLLRWWSFRLGDSVAIGIIYAFFASRALRDYEASGWYTQRWFYIALGAVGLNISSLLLFQAAQARSLSPEDLKNPSELFHAIITWPALTVLVGSSLIPIWTSDSRLLYKIGVTLGLILYFATVGYDMFLNPSRTLPGR